MKNKLDCSSFDDEIDRLKNLIISMAVTDGKPVPVIQTGPSISTKEMNELKEMMKLVNQHEEKL
jgi:hypothetical protein